MPLPLTLWLNAKGSKSESNSQQFSMSCPRAMGCGSMPKVVNLKAIHNRIAAATIDTIVVAQCQR